MIGLFGGMFGYRTDARPLAAKHVTNGWYVTNAPTPIVPTFAFVVFVNLGTGIIGGWGLVPKPGGAGSHYPYGFPVEPDRPRAALP